MTRPSAETVRIRREPTDSDLDRISDAARNAVADITQADGAMGRSEIDRLYIGRIYAAVVAGAIPSKRRPRP